MLRTGRKAVTTASGRPWPSRALTGPHGHSKAHTGTQRPSRALTGPHGHSQARKGSPTPTVARETRQLPVSACWGRQLLHANRAYNNAALYLRHTDTSNPGSEPNSWRQNRNPTAPRKHPRFISPGRLRVCRPRVANRPSARARQRPQLARGSRRTLAGLLAVLSRRRARGHIQGGGLVKPGHLHVQRPSATN